MDQRIDGRGRERVPAHQQRVKAESLAQPFVADVARDHGMDRAPRLQPRQLRRRADHVAEMQERDRAQLFVSFAIDRAGIGQETAIARHVARADRGDLALDGVLVVGIVKDGAVLPAQAIEGIDRQQRHVAVDVVAGQAPQPAQAVGVGDDRGARVEGKARVVIDIGPPAGLVARLEQRGGDARRLQPDRQRKPAETRPDDARAAGPARGHSDAPSRSGRHGSARRIGTGGLPIRMRALSGSVLHPA